MTGIEDGTDATRRVHDGWDGHERLDRAINVHLARDARRLGTGDHGLFDFSVVNQSLENHFDVFHAEFYLEEEDEEDEDEVLKKKKKKKKKKTREQ